MGKGQIDLCPNTGDSEGAVSVYLYLNAFLLEFVMLYSKICRLHFTQLPLFLLAALCLSASLCRAEPDLLSSDMGIASSAANNQIIDTNTIAPPPEPTLSPAEAAELVRKKIGGQVMSVNTQHQDTGVVYGVKVLNDGRMRVINVDGQTGRLLSH